jgi:transposase
MDDKKMQLPVVLKENPKALKLTKKNKAIFFQALAEKWNITAAAVKIGISRQRVYQLLKSDDNFRQAFYAIKDSWLDKAEEVILDYAARGANITANIFTLKTHRDEWKEKVGIDVKHEIDLKNWRSELRRIIDGSPKRIIEAEYKVVKDN